MEFSEPVTAAVITDKDGTLFDTERLGMESWIRAARDFGAELTEADLSELVGRSSEEVTTALVDILSAELWDASTIRASQLESPEEVVLNGLHRVEYMHALIDQMRRLKSDYFESEVAKTGMPTREGFHEFTSSLAAFRESGRARVGLGTSDMRWPTMRQLERAGLTELFDTVVCADDVIHVKPSPEVFLRAADHLGAAPDSCIVIEDSAAGVQAGLAAGMRVIAVPGAGNLPKELAAKADKVCDSLHQVTRRLHELLDPR